MPEQKLTIAIVAKNLAKGVLSALDKTLGQGAKSARGLESGLGGSLLKANLLSSAITGGIGAGLSAVQNLVGGVSSAIGSAADSQQQLLAATASFSAVSGRTFQEASRFISEFEKDLVKSVASLPGATSGYLMLSRAIADELVPAFKSLDGTLDEEGLSRSLGSITANAGLLGAAAGLQGSDTGLAVQRVFGGASTAELRQLAFFERNPALLRELEESLAEAGAKSFRELDPASISKILEDSLALFATPELKRQMANSFGGLVEGFRSLLFDDKAGIFGFLRDLDPNQIGDQTLLNRFTETTRLLIGEGGILDQIGSAASRLLGGRDPLVIVDNALAGFNQLLEDFELGNLRETLGTFFTEGLPDLINVGVDNALGFIRDFDWANAGKVWADVVGNLWSGTITFIRNIDWSDILSTISLGITGVRDFLLNYWAETLRKMLDAAGKAARELIFPTDFRAANVDDFLPGSPVARTATPVVRGRYQGIQPGDGGILGGIISELANKPKSSELVIANTSEAILRPNQALNVVSNAMAAGASAGGRNGPITINVNASFNRGNLDDEFNEFMMRFERMVLDSIAGNLT